MLMRSELHGTVRTIQTQMDDDGEEQGMYRSLLRTKLALLMTLTENHDAVIELNSFYRFLLNNFSNSESEISLWRGFYSFASLRYSISYLITPSLSKLRHWGSNNSAEKQHDRCGRKKCKSVVQLNDDVLDLGVFAEEDNTGV